MTEHVPLRSGVGTGWVVDADAGEEEPTASIAASSPPPIATHPPSPLSRSTPVVLRRGECFRSALLAKASIPKNRYPNIVRQENPPDKESIHPARDTMVRAPIRQKLPPPHTTLTARAHAHATVRSQQLPSSGEQRSPGKRARVSGGGGGWEVLGFDHSSGS